MDRSLSKYYVASSLNNKTRVRHIISELTLAGYRLTYDWTTHGQVHDVKDLARIGELEANGVKLADFLVLLMPARYGSHVELGIAIAFDKPVFIITEGQTFEEKSFYHLPNVRRYSDVKELIKDLVK